MLAGLAGLAYYLYTTNNSKEGEVKKNVQQQERPNVQDNNVHSNNVNRLRSFRT